MYINISEAVQLNFYPSCPEPNRAMGLAPHTDTSLFTILHQSRITGLQIFKEGKEWVPVHPHPNTLVVHTGDLLHIISNARFRSALHRVTVNSTRERYSVAYFYSPPLDYVVSPLVDSVARFRDVTVKEEEHVACLDQQHSRKEGQTVVVVEDLSISVWMIPPTWIVFVA